MSELVFLFLGEVRHLRVLHLLLQLPWEVKKKKKVKRSNIHASDEAEQWRPQGERARRRTREGRDVSAAARKSLRCTQHADIKHEDAHLMSRNNEVSGEETPVYIHTLLYIKSHSPCLHETERGKGSLRFYPRIRASPSCWSPQDSQSF